MKLHPEPGCLSTTPYLCKTQNCFNTLVQTSIDYSPDPEQNQKLEALSEVLQLWSTIDLRLLAEHNRSLHS